MGVIRLRAGHEGGAPYKMPEPSVTRKQIPARHVRAGTLLSDLPAS